MLELVAAGRSNAEIAGELYLSVGTVKAHVHHIFGKLLVRTAPRPSQGRGNCACSISPSTLNRR